MRNTVCYDVTSHQPSQAQTMMLMRRMVGWWPRQPDLVLIINNSLQICLFPYLKRTHSLLFTGLPIVL